MFTCFNICLIALQIVEGADFNLNFVKFMAFLMLYLLDMLLISTYASVMIHLVRLLKMLYIWNYINIIFF